MEKISVKDLNNINLKSKIICFPTDTVYGVGCMIDDLDAIKKIYDMKNIKNVFIKQKSLRKTQALCYIIVQISVNLFASSLVINA